MTATTHIQKAGRAIAEARERYVICSPVFGEYYVRDMKTNEIVSLTYHYKPDCQNVIDELSATAAFESVLPVADDVLEAAENAYDESAVRHRHQVCQVDALIDALTAAIRAICGRGK